MLETLWNITYSSVLVVIGIFLDRIFESRPKLVTYYGHVAAGKLRIANENMSAIQINTHSIVIANRGRKPALNVRVGHYPIISHVKNMVAIYPESGFNVNVIPDVGEEIVFDRLLPKQSIMINYIYSGLTFNQITRYVRFDEGEAKFLPVVISRQYPKWLVNTFGVIVFIGFITTIYCGYEIFIKLLH